MIYNINCNQEIHKTKTNRGDCILKARLIRHNYKINHQPVNEGDLVRINFNKIVSSKDYYKLNKSYCQFLEENKETIFIAFYENKQRAKNKLVSLKTQDGRVLNNFLFNPVDLIKL